MEAHRKQGTEVIWQRKCLCGNTSAMQPLWIGCDRFPECWRPARMCTLDCCCRPWVCWKCVQERAQTLSQQGPFFSVSLQGLKVPGFSPTRYSRFPSAKKILARWQEIDSVWLGNRALNFLQCEFDQITTGLALISNTHNYNFDWLSAGIKGTHRYERL